ncbi:restriction endonuclease [Pseudomonas sp. CCI3.2]|uniref:restriction endonuclease n=1 Tax=unclassified Pseudomonas TaxID=196821 RepID=UPI002AC8F4BA|nr:MULTISPECIES: restriction endonuclease [unclassified Pseudomonas]MEB0079405.1 restriction endonuclease [Pseudomonas sp. MH10out]MEB0103759.1 restriction endonuclease [Pseudomonas sp. CCI3.2]MEB0132396.1 restriction endonuclease [Pseudomonas sp. CCI2.4]MEB0159678.1 restriction endonuclease [Pseudomonas sp. AH2 (2023)]MEB0169114.1 restriction endonuclease [Pseudomonas sp. CCC4.4]
MSVPTYDQFIEPILRYLAETPAGAMARDAHEAAANALNLSEAQRQELIASGQAVYKNRAGWAHDRLKRAGLSSSARRGYWQLTDAGISYAAEHPHPIAADKIEQLAIGFMDVKLRTPIDTMPLDEQEQTASVASSATVSPDDRLEQALRELREATATDLLDNLLQVSPNRFEVIVLDVLHRLGYGANRNDLQRVGGSGDSGIDGVISLDKLGLEKVYVQAKRWQGTVGRPELQAFFGALAGQKAKRGVFITTSGFTAQAMDFARSVEGMVLVDGNRLVNLMMDHEVGITSRMLKLPKLDSDYFDE